MDGTELITLITAAGALGTAAFGIVDALKAFAKPLGEAGYSEIPKNLGELKTTLKTAFGEQYEVLLKAQYRGNAEDFARTLRQGVRIGLTSTNAEAVAEFLGVLDGPTLKKAVEMIEKAEFDLAELAEQDPAQQDAVESAAVKALEEAQRILGRYEMAADARIDAATIMSQEVYKGTARCWAMVTAITLGLLGGLLAAQMNGESTSYYIILGLFVGVAAVPLAPIAKDVASAIQSTAAALRKKT
jgi:hypothetical protein